MARTQIDRADARFGWMIAAPALAALFLVILFPVIWAVFTSVHDYTLINPHFDTYSGLANFRRAITDPEFRHSLGLTAFFVVAVVALEFLLGFLVALMLNTVERMKPVYYGILLCPLLMNPVVVGLILGPLAELQCRRALAISEGDASVFVTRPVCAALLLLAGVALLTPSLVRRWAPSITS